MELLTAVEDAALVERILSNDAALSGSALGALFRQNRRACEQIAASLRAQRPLGDADADSAIAYARDLFDGLVEQSEEASVAMYSLGNPDILAACTDELVNYLQAAGVLTLGARVLDIGCGIGRLEVALAPRVAAIHGVDVSPAMLERARLRCANLANVQLSVGSGRDLAQIETGSCSLVLAVDCFPYLVAGGPGLAAEMVAEVSRVLAAPGYFVLFNYSYRDDLTLDRREVSALAARYAFEAIALGTQPLSLWNGRLFSLRKRAEP
jgi:SAM-dependent methyltransferase